MTFITTLAFILTFGHVCYAEMKVSDSWNPDGSSKILWTDLTEEQKAQHYEWERENNEYFDANIGKKCSELKNVPEYTKMFSMISQNGLPLGPDDICFSTEPLRYVYARSGEFDKWYEEERKYYESGGGPEDEAPYMQLNWLNVMLSAGHYREAVKFFPEFVNINYPWFKKEEVIERLKKGEGPPKVLARSIIVEPWAKILAVKDNPDDYRKPYREKEKNMEPSERMHRSFYSSDVIKRAEALEFYKTHKVKFMIKKAKKDWSGDLKTKAEKYLEELQKSTTTQ